MRDVLRTTYLTLAIISASAAWASVAAQAAAAAGKSPSAETIQACSLMTKADIEKLTGQRLFGEPQATALYGGSACGWGSTQIVLFSGENSEERYNALLKNFGKDTEQKHPVSGVGDRAYMMFPKPRNQYEDTIALLVITSGQHTMGISVAAEKGQSGESVQPTVMALAKTVVEKLR